MVPPKYEIKRNLLGVKKPVLVREGKLFQGHVVGNSDYISSMDQDNMLDYSIADLEKRGIAISIVDKAPVERLTSQSARQRDRDNFEKEFKTDDLIRITNRYGPELSNESDIYKIVDTSSKQGILVQNTDSNEEFLIKNEELSPTKKFTITKTDSHIVEVNKALADYSNGLTPYPVAGFNY